MDDQEKTVTTDMQQTYVQGAMGIDAANTAVSQLLSKATEVLQAGDQPIYVLSAEAAREVLAGLQANPPEAFVQTSAWPKPAPPADNCSDELLAAMGTQLQSGDLAAASEGETQVHCEYGDEVYVLPDKTSVQEFIANVAAGDATGFQQTHEWGKKTAGLTDNRQEALLADIAARLKSIEAILLRLETLFQTMNVNR